MLNALKVNTTDLDIGMFVSGLDRPWLETPFVTQGFYIESPTDIHRLREYCEYVLVDSQRSRRGGGPLGPKKKPRPSQESPARTGAAPIIAMSALRKDACSTSTASKSWERTHEASRMTPRNPLRSPPTSGRSFVT